MISTGPVHREGSREKKSKHDEISVWGVRVSTGRFLGLFGCKNLHLRGVHVLLSRGFPQASLLV